MNVWFGARIADVYYLQAELLPIFCWNLPIIVTMATRMGLSKF